MTPSVFAEHSEVLAHWWQRRSSPPPALIYLDAHLDLQFVSKERIERLRQCKTPEAVRALAKPHHLWPDGDFSYSIEDFLYPAAQLGLLEQVIWVTPPHVDTEDLQQAFIRLQQMEGVELEALESFRRNPGGWIEGCLFGLRLTICSIDQLEDIPLPAACALDIDVDYFISVPGDFVWVNPVEIFSAVCALPTKLVDVTISFSVSSGFTPLRYRFLGDFLAALWSGDTVLAGHFERLLSADRLVRVGNDIEAIEACNRELALFPGCAATWYLLALGQGATGEASRSLARAQAICTDYKPDWLRSACQIRGRRLPIDMASVRVLEQQIPTLGLSPAQTGIAWAAAGLLYAMFNDLGRAEACNRQFREQFGHGHGELCVELAKLWLAAGRPISAIPYLESALIDDESRITGHVYLAQALASIGKIAEAKSHLAKAQSLSPAWVELLAMLAVAENVAGNHVAAAEMAAWHRKMQNRSQRLFARLAVPV